MTKDAPAVSVVIPTHNRARLVTRALASVLGQQGDPGSIEVVVVDDASRDGTSAVLAQFGTRIRVITTDAPVERGRCRNLGAEAARAELVAFLDSDDEWAPSKLVRQLPALRTVPAAVTGIKVVDDEGHPLRTHIPPESAAVRLPFENLYLATPSTLVIRRSTFLSIGGFPEEDVVQGSEDWIFLARLIKVSGPPLVVPEPLTLYRVHGTNSTANPDAVARSMWAATEMMQREGLVDGRQAPRARAHVAGVIGRHYASNKKWTKSVAWARRAVSSHPVTGLRSSCLVAASAIRAAMRRS